MLDHCEWSAWEMGDCSVTCGEGVVKKTRKNVYKAHEEDDHEHDEHDHDDDEVEHCPGMEEVEENCHLHECPGNFTYHKISYILMAKYTFFSHSRYGIKCFISDNYTYLAGKHCTGGPIGSYTTLQAAIAACSNNNRCGCIFDLGCDGDEWWIREGHGVRSSVPSYGSCAWEKRNGKQ